MKFLNTPIKGEIYRAEMDSPVGKLFLEFDAEALIRIKTTEPRGTTAALKKANENEILSLAVKELGAYFCGELKEFSIPVKPAGTEFQMKVWQALCDIPYGETCSYKEIAEAIGSPGACRAVGMANNRNPIWIIIPCHRVIGADGSLVGYGGGLDAKEKLLKSEKAI